MSVQISSRASKKITLHACKYPNSDVVGILLGKGSPGNYEVVDVYPTEKLKEDSLSIIGAYECTIFDEGISAASVQFCRAMRDYFVEETEEPEDFDPSKKTLKAIMDFDEDKKASVSIDATELDDSSSQKKLTTVDIDNSTLKGLFENKNITSLFDVDNHFENAACDIRNPQISN